MSAWSIEDLPKGDLYRVYADSAEDALSTWVNLGAHGYATEVTVSHAASCHISIRRHIVCKRNERKTYNERNKRV